MPRNSRTNVRQEITSRYASYAQKQVFQLLQMESFGARHSIRLDLGISRQQTGRHALAAATMTICVCFMKGTALEVSDAHCKAKYRFTGK